MAEVSGFKRISVSADSDDDVVIWAGTDAEGASLEVPDSVQIQNVGVEPTLKESNDSAQFVKPTPVEVCDSAQINEVPDSTQVNQDALEGLGGSAKPAPAPVERTAQPAAKDLGYRETTLDDLKSEPMSKTQKIIIACAIAAVAAAVVYYFVFMR